MRWLSWNLNGLDEAHLDARTEGALFTALLGGPPERVLMSGAPPPPPPDGLLFQEVVERSLVAHLRPHLKRAGYTLFPDHLPDRSYFEVIAVRAPHEVARFTLEALPGSHYGRELLGVELTSGLRVYTGHLDSLREGSSARKQQLRFVLERLADGPALFAGDSNLRDAEVGDLGRAADAWEAMGSQSRHRITWPGRRGMRFDRAYVSGLTVTGFRTLGRERLPQTGGPPSDHLAIEVTLQQLGPGSVSANSHAD